MKIEQYMHNHTSLAIFEGNPPAGPSSFRPDTKGKVDVDYMLFQTRQRAPHHSDWARGFVRPLTLLRFNPANGPLIIQTFPRKRLPTVAMFCQRHQGAPHP